MRTHSLVTLLTVLSVARSQRLVDSNQMGQLCGGQMTGNSGSFSSPNYNRRSYPDNLKCIWEISVPAGKVIEFEFVSMDVEQQPPDCPFDGIILHDVKEGFTANPSSEKEIYRYLGKTKYCGDAKFSNVISRTNKVVAIFYSDEADAGLGFNITWNAIPNPPDEQDCDFERGLCRGWEDLRAPDDNFDWVVYRGATPTTLTGPFFDHTLKNANGKYVYIETSYPQASNDTAVLATPSIEFNASETKMCLSFWYHMYGQHVGTLAVAISVGNNSTIQWLKSGEQGPNWIKADLEVPRQTAAFKIMFVGICGSGIMGDIALDDVTLRRTSCYSATTQSSASASATDAPIGSSSASTTTSFPPATTNTTNCKQLEYMCVSGLSCIPAHYKCDGMQDCPDNDDEVNCNGTNNNLPPVITTPEPDDFFDSTDYDIYTTDDFTSSSVDAIANTAASATTSSHDVVATTQQTTKSVQPVRTTVDMTSAVSGCSEGKGLCKDGACIPTSWICDGQNDCPDGDDEWGCPTAETAVETTTVDYDYGFYDNYTDPDENTTQGVDEATPTTTMPDTTSTTTTAATSSSTMPDTTSTTTTAATSSSTMPDTTSTTTTAATSSSTMPDTTSTTTTAATSSSTMPDTTSTTTTAATSSTTMPDTTSTTTTAAISSTTKMPDTTSTTTTADTLSIKTTSVTAGSTTSAQQKTTTLSQQTETTEDKVDSAASSSSTKLMENTATTSTTASSTTTVSTEATSTTATNGAVTTITASSADAKTSTDQQASLSSSTLRPTSKVSTTERDAETARVVTTIEGVATSRVVLITNAETAKSTSSDSASEDGNAASAATLFSSRPSFSSTTSRDTATSRPALRDGDRTTTSASAQCVPLFPFVLTMATFLLVSTATVLS